IGGGTNLKSLIYKGDVAKACRKVLESRDISGIFNLTADAVPMAEIVGEIYHSLGRKKSRVSISPKLFKFLFWLNERTVRLEKIEKLSETVRKWLSDDVFAGDKFRRTYNFQPEISIKEAVKREVEGYRRQK
ncbi:MAG: hypothetical protein M3T96_06915, partial [Acidobacteriota bacterium]|nr:hypothetical protein [Acidobacteriota bacterium]